jgi:hypothetical protein
MRVYCITAQMWSLFSKEIPSSIVLHGNNIVMSVSNGVAIDTIYQKIRQGVNI